MDRRRLASIVTVNYNGRRFLKPLLDSLRVQTYPCKEVILIDNASTDDSVDYVRRHYPEVRVVVAPRNLGFSAGNNLAFRHCDGEFIALINNDAVAESGWLAALADELEAHPHAGAVGSKITFLKRFIALRIVARGAPLLLDAASGFVDCDYAKTLYKSGWAGEAELGGARGRWLSDAAELWLPVPGVDAAARLELRLAALGESTRCTVRCEDEVLIAERPLGREAQALECELGAALLARASFYVVNNAASRLDERGNAADRGIGEADRGQFDRAEDVEALCGCAMAVRREVLERTGGFDEAFFMYYEDTDLSWRIRKLGYTLRYQPASVVRHWHAASTVEWSPFFVFHVARNRVLISLKNSPPSYALVPFLDELGRLFGCAARCAAAVLRLRAVPRALLAELGTRLRVQLSLLYAAPRVFARRWVS